MPTLATNGAIVAYTDTGAPPGRPDAPTIVFGHGLLFSGWMFHPQIEALSSSFRCVAIDWRGQGQSPPAAAYDMDALYDDAVALIEHLEVGPVHWVGLSMGGFVGQRIGARRPGLLRSLVLLDTSADREERSALVQDLALSVVYRLAGIAPVRRPVLKIMLGPAFRNDPASAPVIDEWMCQLEATDRAGLVGAIRAVALRKAIRPEIGRIAAPTLVIVGADDVPTPVRKARAIAEAIPGARLEVVPEAGHSITIEQPVRVVELLSAFLGEVDVRD
ncbi:MAG: 3-oxoadipate enol-lactonase [Pseudonocardiales bacterium]|nr:3-oxoadipate enol-lactonase [Pseudonocardiales bacterium]